MCKILPGLSCDALDVSSEKMALLAVEHYLLIGLYTFALFLATANIWRILIKQRRYKTLPLLVFYICAFISVALRWIYTILIFTSFH